MSIVAGSVAIIFLLSYSLRRVGRNIKKNLISTLLLICVMLGIGKLMIDNEKSTIYSTKIIASLNQKIISNKWFVEKFGENVGLSYAYKLIAYPMIGSIFVAIGCGLSKEENERGEDYDEEQEAS